MSSRSATVARIIIDNDFAGDPDGLFQLAHYLLCPSVKIPLIIGSHLPVQFGGLKSASEGSAKACELQAMAEHKLTNLANLCYCFRLGGCHGDDEHFTPRRYEAMGGSAS